MSREATAHLRVTVSDEALVGHAQRLQETKKAWNELQATVSGFKVSRDVDKLGKALSHVSAASEGNNLQKATDFYRAVSGATQGINAEALKAVAQSVKAVKVVGDVDKAGLQTFVDFFTKVGQVDGSRFASVGEAFSKIALVTPRTGAGLESIEKAIRELQNVDISKLRDIAHAFTDIAAAASSADGVSASLRAQHKDLKAILVLAEKITKQVEEEKNTHKKTNKELGTKKSLMKRVQQDFIRMSSVLFIMYHNIRSFVRQLEDAGKQVDLMRNLSLSIGDFGDKMEKAREATRGTVSQLELMKSMALMTSFGISIENFDKQMAMVQKMARRTGQDTEYLMSSLATGVSRLSPMILDNLGLQISLSKSYDTYAASLGKASGALTELEKKTAVMNEVMRQSANLTADVDTAVSVSSRLERATTRLSDFYRGALAGMLETFDAAFRGAEEVTRDMNQMIQLATREAGENAKSFTYDYLDFMASEYPEAVSGAVLAIAKAQEFLGVVEKRTVTLTKEGQENLEKQNAAKMRLVETNRFLYKEIGRLNKAWEQDMKAARVGVLLANERQARFAKAIRATEEFTAAVRDMTEAEEAAFRVSERGQRLRREAEGLGKGMFDEAAQNLQVTLELLAAQKEKLDTVKELYEAQEDAFKDELHQRMVEDAFNKKAEAAMEERNKLALEYRTLIKMGVDFTEQLTVEAAQLYVQARKEATENHRLFIEQRDKERRVLNEQREIVVDGFNISQGILKHQYEHNEAVKRLQEEQNKYNKMLEKSTALGADEAEFATDAILKQGELVLARQKEVELLKERAKYQELFRKASESVTWMSKQERMNQAVLLAGGRNRLQVERDMLKLKAKILDKEKQVAHMLKLQATVQIMAGTMMSQMMSGQIKEAQEALRKLQEEFGREVERIERFPREGGLGGRGRRAKDDPKPKKKKPLIEEVFGSTHDMSVVMTEQGYAASRLFVQAFARTMEYEFKDGQRVERVQRELLKSFSTDLDLREQFERTDAGGFIARPREIKEVADKAIKEIEKFIKSVDGKLSEATKTVLDKQLMMLRVRKEAAEEEIKHLDNVVKKLDDVSEAMGNAFGFGDMTIMFGRQFKIAMAEVTKSSQMFSDALKQQEYNTYDLVAATGPALRGITAMFLDSAKKRATVEMILNVAQAWAAAAVPNIPKAIAHGTAATMFGLVAGGVLRLPGGASSARREDTKTQQRGGPLHIHLYGDSMATEGERARHIEQIMAEARAEGRV